MSQFETVQHPEQSVAPSVHQNPPKPTIGHDRLNDTPSNLNEKQLAAIELLAAGKTYSRAAKVLGIDRSTLFLWRRKAEFQQRLEARVQELWGAAKDRLRSLVEPSLEVLAEQLEDNFGRTQFRAASVVLRLAKLGTINERA